jgi:hypothetical protein
MRELIAIYRKEQREIRIFKSKKKVRAEVYQIKPFKYQNVFYNRVCSDVEAFLKLKGEARMLKALGFENCYRVPFERRNGKIVLFPVNKQRRIIFTNDDYAEWCEAMADEITEDEINPEVYYNDCEINLDDERCNLNIEVDGYIVAFANLGFWNGRCNGAALIGDNVKDILNSSYSCDNVTFYCDPYNVKFDGSHHDGSHHLLFRVAKDKDAAERLVNKIAYHDMSEEAFRKATRSLRPYVAKVYGW